MKWIYESLTSLLPLLKTGWHAEGEWEKERLFGRGSPFLVRSATQMPLLYFTTSSFLNFILFLTFFYQGADIWTFLHSMVAYLAITVNKSKKQWIITKWPGWCPLNKKWREIESWMHKMLHVGRVMQTSGRVADVWKLGENFDSKNPWKSNGIILPTVTFS